MAKKRTKAPRKRLSLSEIAEKSGRDPAHISKVLNGRPCRLETAADISDAMGITIDQLYRDYIKGGGWGFR